MENKLPLYNPEGFALQIFKDRYSISPEETFQEACHRVANFIASAEDGEKIKEFEERFFNIISQNRFSPGGRIWRGSGRKRPACMNCFLLPSEDSREGWGELLKEVTIISGLGGGIGISFDNIRPRGTEIKGTGGISTGSVSLMKIINGVCNELREGGGRRSALLYGLSYTHPDVEEFLHIKLDKKELNNANISILVDNKFFDLVESNGEIELKWQGKILKTIKAKWLYDKVIENSLKTGDPGYINMGLAKEMNNLWYCREQTCSNPCLPLRSIIITKNGLRTLGQINIGEEIWSESGWTKITDIIPRGKKSVYRFETTRGYIESTLDHKIINNGIKTQISESESIDTLFKETKLDKLKLNPLDIMDGLVIGDGTIYNKHTVLCIGKNDQDYFNSEINELINELCSSQKFIYKIKTSITPEEIQALPLRKIPDRFYYGNTNKIIGFLRGLYSANGCFVKDRGRGKIGLKSTSKYLICQVQQMLSSLGIRSYYIRCDKHKRIFKEGQREYECKESYGLFITWDRKVFASCIGFLQKYKQDKLNNFILSENKSCRPYEQFTKIRSIEYVEDTSVFDITVDNSSHTLWCNGFNVANCGEQILPPYSVCCLGAINLSSHVEENGEINWALLDDTVRLAIRFLDNVIDKNEYPLQAIKEWSQKERRIGCGVMGLHDMLLKMRIKYSSEKALSIIDKVMSFIKKKAYDASIFLSVEKGQFPLLDRKKFIEGGFCKKSLTPSLRKKILEYGIRNCFLLTIAPTGTTSIVAGCSSGIEPMFAPVHKRNFNTHKDFHSKLTQGSSEIIIHPLFKQFILDNKDYSHFEGSHDISPEQHCKIQVICQKHICNAVSKTINLPEKTTEKELSGIMIKYIRNLKGMTIYRDKSKGESPLMPLPIEEAKKYLDQCKTEATDNSCPSGKCEL